MLSPLELLLAKLIHEKGYQNQIFLLTKGIQSLFEYSPQDVNLSTNKRVLTGCPVITRLGKWTILCCRNEVSAPEADLQSGKFRATWSGKKKKETY